jgi:putative ABC transport system permease protein
MVAAIVLGVATATLATGLTGTIIALVKANHGGGAPQVDVAVGSPHDRRVAPKLTDPGIEALLRSLPGVRRVTARAFFQAAVVGHPDLIYVDFYRGDPPDTQVDMVRGRRPTGPGEVVTGRAFLILHGQRIGDRITLAVGGRRETVTIVGETANDNGQDVEASWPTLAALAPGTAPVEYRVTLAPGADDQAYAGAVHAADPGLYPSVLGQGGAVATTIVTFAAVFTVLLVAVAALGVVNTVLLNIRERRRDLGVLKSIGMTPRQVVGMVLGSVAALGAVGGLLGIPVGVAAHRLILDHLGTMALPPAWKNVWSVPELAAMALAGVLIAVLGALPPARTAARLPVAAVLHTE